MSKNTAEGALEQCGAVFSDGYGEKSSMTLHTGVDINFYSDLPGHEIWLIMMRGQARTRKWQILP